MKLYSMVLSFMLIVPALTSCKSVQNSTENQDFSDIPKVLHDITDEFLLNRHDQLNIFIFNSKLQVLHDIANNFMAQLNETFQLQFSTFQSLRVQNVINLMFPTFLFIDDIFMFEHIELAFDVVNFQNRPIKHFVFIANFTFNQLASSEIFNYFKRLLVIGSGVFTFTYFITDEIESVTLSTVEWFSPQACHRPQLHKLNTFDKNSQKWNSKLEDYEKFEDFHSCELVMMLPVPLIDSFVYHSSGFAIVNDDETDFEVKGISPVIFDIAGEHYGFRPAYQPVEIGPYWLINLNGDESAEPIPINYKIKVPDVYFEIFQLSEMHGRLWTSSTVTNLNVCMFVTPGEVYTQYEKFILPFDIQTWILLLVTFLVTFLTILIINQLSKSTQSMVYGDKVATPIWNVIRIFFGISQTKLPNKKFSRFILMIFIYFCLVFRTCFQSKFFEFMTTAPRHPSPKTLEDLRERSYQMYTLKATNDMFLYDNKLNSWKEARVARPEGFHKVLLSQSQNASAKLALTIDEYYVNAVSLELMKNNQKWNKLEDLELFTSQDVFYFYGAAYYTRMLVKVIESLIPTGIMNHLIEKYYTKKWKFPKIEKEPKVLTLDDLAFGFNIWLGCCLLSLVGHVAEHFVRFVRKPKKLKFAKVHPINDEDDVDDISMPELLMTFKINTSSSEDVEEVAFGERIICIKSESNELEDEMLNFLSVVVGRDISNSFMSKLNESFDYSFRAIVNYNVEFSFAIIYPIFMFIDDILTLTYIEETFDITHNQNQPIKHFIFISSLTYDQLNSSKIFDYYQRLPVVGGGFFVFAYFITNEIETVTLSTVEWFSPQACHRPQLHKLNTFDKKSQKWNSKLEDYVKFENYHNCDLVMMLPTPLPDHVVYHPSGYAFSNDDDTDFNINGITPVIFVIAGTYYGFRPDFQPVNMFPDWLTDLEDEKVVSVPINHNVKKPEVYFELKTLDLKNVRLQTTSVVLNLKFDIFITPGEKYTQYEKFILPFDIQTWILLLVTFLVTFLTILIINQLSKSTQSMVYGDKVATPIWNVIRIFFGISQTKLPNKKFSRFILMIFIYFCLVFRTCFQSKFFEFMTSEPRHPAPRTLQDLRDRNYQMHSLEAAQNFFHYDGKLNNWKDVKIANPIRFHYTLITQSQNASAKLALIADEFNVNSYNTEFIKRNSKWNKLKDFDLLTTQNTFYFYGAAHYTRILVNVIESLIPTGIMNFLIEKYYTKKWKFPKIEKEPKVLTLDDLAFGFNIWLGCCLLSLVGHVAEHFVRFVTKPKKLKFAKVHPINVEDDVTEVHHILKAEILIRFRIKTSTKEDLEEIAFGEKRLLTCPTDDIICITTSST
ncbi:unnamed protein product [Chironomus riparius]|uniref:Ionotropic glutamate receptor C-terminal domain-containing protein n=1 Tax=Chironomus riparius TaxID=315576 RepID=A0A9N9WXL9_9DIPT|nr:unnamed protein product [Chironomus riparius]